MQLTNAVTGTFLANLNVASNLDDTGGKWRQSPAYDLSVYRGQVVRVRFMALNDGTNLTGFLIDDLTITAGFTAATSIPRVFGISTRMGVLTGDNVPIGGFIIGGSTPKTVVVRARGPSLGVAGALADPVLTLVPASGAAPIVNDNWETGANAAALSGSGFAPANRNESAILVTLDPGAYTAIVTGAGGTTGVAIVEVYTQ